MLEKLSTELSELVRLAWVAGSPTIAGTTLAVAAAFALAGLA